MSGLLINHNFGKSLLAGGISASDTAATVLSGDGAKFPSTGDFVCVLWDSAYASPVSDLSREIIKVTARSTDTLTIVRAQEGTTNKAWNTDDHIALVITAGKLDEIQDEARYAGIGGNLLHNASWGLWQGVNSGAPTGWTLTGAGATVSVANGTYGHRALTLTAAAAQATLSQTLSADVPRVASAYGIAAFASVSSGGTGNIYFDAISVPVTNTSLELKQATDAVTAWEFGLQIDAGYSITVEMPTVTLGKSLPYPMYGQKDLIAEPGFPGFAKSASSLANGASRHFSLAGLAKASTATVLTVRVQWIGTGSTAYGGVLSAVHYISSGGSYKGPMLFKKTSDGPITTDKNSVTDLAGYVCLFQNSSPANTITLKNNLGDTIYYTAEYLWG